MTNWEDDAKALIELSKKLESVKTTHKPIHDKLKEILVKNKYLLPEQYSNQLSIYFNAIFQNISSNSVTLCTINNHNSYRETIITMGKYGFGVRRRKQANPVNNYDDIKNFKTYMDPVIEALEARKKFTKADELKKFYGILDTSTYTKVLDSVDIPLARCVDIIKTNDYNSLFKTHTVNSLTITLYDERERVNIFFNPDRIELENPKNQNCVSKIGSYISNFLILDQEQHILDAFDKIISSQSNQQSVVIEQMEKEFGRYLMCKAL
jgi:hypothetical protein